MNASSDIVDTCKDYLHVDVLYVHRYQELAAGRLRGCRAQFCQALGNTPTRCTRDVEHPVLFVWRDFIVLSTLYTNGGPLHASLCSLPQGRGPVSGPQLATAYKAGPRLLMSMTCGALYSPSCINSPCNLLFLNLGIYGLVQAAVGVGTVIPEE